MNRPILQKPKPVREMTDVVTLVNGNDESRNISHRCCPYPGEGNSIQTDQRVTSLSMRG